MQVQIDTKPLLRPHQVEELKDELRGVEQMLDPTTPAHLRQRVDVQNAASYARRTRQKIEAETPRPLTGKELDEAVRVEATLREAILDGMPTQAEMRRNPPGAVGKHVTWEKKNKGRLLAWKNLALRMLASDAPPAGVTDPREVANFERYRPAGGAGELNLDVAQIQGANIHLPNGPIASQNHMGELDRLKAAAETLDLIARLADQGWAAYVVKQNLVDAWKEHGADDPVEVLAKVNAGEAPPKK